MKIQFLNGGLANQAFQYIFARHYELSHPGDTMYMDDSYFALNTVHNGYELEKVFGIHPHMLSSCFDERVWNFILDARQKEHKSVPQILMENQIPIDMVSEVGEECHRFNPFEGRRFHVRCHQYCPEVFAIPEAEENIYYHGYWLNTAWFAAYRDIFLKEFRFPEITDERNLHYLNEITSSPSVSIHIRRGDYITLNMAPLMKFTAYAQKPFLCNTAATGISSSFPMIFPGAKNMHRICSSTCLKKSHSSKETFTARTTAICSL